MRDHMRTSALRRGRPVPARPLFSRAPDPPGVYHSTVPVRDRWVFYALGPDAELLGCGRPECHETDDEIVARLMSLIYEDPRPTALALVSSDSLIAHGFSPSLHRPLSLPRLVREREA